MAAACYAVLISDGDVDGAIVVDMADVGAEWLIVVVRFLALHGPVVDDLADDQRYLVLLRCG